MIRSGGFGLYHWDNPLMREDTIGRRISLGKQVRGKMFGLGLFLSSLISSCHEVDISSYYAALSYQRIMYSANCASEIMRKK